MSTLNFKTFEKKLLLRHYAIFFILILVSLISCQYETWIHKKRKPNQLVVEFSKTIQNKSMHLAGVGERVDHDNGKTKFLQAIFGIKALRDVPEARKLQVETLNAFLNFINSSDDEIKDQLSAFPFSFKNVQVSIVNENRKGGDISYVFNFEDKLCYFSKSENPHDFKVTEILEETFEEAQQRLKESNSM